MILPPRQVLRELCQSYGIELHRIPTNQVHFLIREGINLPNLCSQLRQENYYLLSVIANDERELEDRCFKIYYLFSHPAEDLLLILENALPPGAQTYFPIFESFPAVIPFEREIADTFGLFPMTDASRIPRQTFLHPCFPPDLFPLRRDRNDEELAQQLALYNLPEPDIPGIQPELLAKGEIFIPVGPIHAGVIEPGLFQFRISGETIEEVDIRLGYTHKGLERLFQTHFTLENGWQLAEQVSGDSSFAHSLAYCLAVENLAGREVPPEASLLRGMFLELERLTNHLGDCAALVHDVVLEMVAAELAVLREEVMRLNEHLAGNRFLRGLNRPGGVQLPFSFVVEPLQHTLDRLQPRFLTLIQMVLDRVDVRERMVNVGVLARTKALTSGVTGLIARAAGLPRDFRVQYPIPPYSTGILQCYEPALSLPALTGDTFSRFLIRIHEVVGSIALIRHFGERWSGNTQKDFVDPVNFAGIPNFEFGIGCVEGWRGGIVYWMMKDRFSHLYRCKVCDPSTLNWVGLKTAIEPQKLNETWHETLLADFPLINKSFNLSYSGTDL